MEPILDRSLFHQPYARRGRSRLRSTLTTFAAFIAFIPIAVSALYFISSPLGILTAVEDRAAATVAVSPFLVERSVAAASAQLSGLDAVADSVYRWLCPYIGTCGEKAQLAPASPARPLAPISAPAVAIATTTRAAPKYVYPPPQQTIINQPVIERIVEREVAVPQTDSVSYSVFETRLRALEQSFNARLAAQTASANATFVSTPVFAQSQRIDTLNASVISGTITNALDVVSGVIDSLAGDELTYTRATFTSATTTNLYASSLTATDATVGSLSATTTATSTFAGGVAVQRINGTATSTLSGLIVDSSGLRLSALDCSSMGNGGTLTTDPNGNVVCAADDGGAGSTVGGSDTYVQFNSGGSFAGDSGLTYASSSDRLTVVNASTTNITASYASTSNLVVSTGLTFKAVTGFLKATAGAVATALIDLANDVTGTLPAGNGGTGLASVTANQLLVGNSGGTGWTQIATSSLAINTDNTIEGSTNLFFTNARARGALSGSSPISYNSGTGAFGFDFSTANTWTGLNIFSQASSTLLSIFDRLYVGGTATTTISGSATSTFGAGIETSYLNVTGTAATSTYANGIKLSGGCFEMPNGSCLSISGGGSGTVGIGTIGQFPYYAADGTTLTATSSISLATTGNVGIGTTSPSTLLHLYNSSAAIEQRFERGQALSNGDTIAAVAGYGGSSTGVSRKYGALDIIASTTTNGSEEGKVQVSWRNGANTEAALFNPYGLILQNAAHNSTLDIYLDNGRGIVMRSPDQNNSGGPFGGNNWYTLSLSSSNQLDLQAPTSGEIRFFVGTAGSGGQKAVIDSSGNFGIGTTSPDRPLVVSSSVGELVELQDSANSGNSAIAYMEFIDSGGTRTGYVGDADGSSKDLVLFSNGGDIRIYGTGGNCTLTGAASGGSCFSDVRLKTVQGEVTGTLDKLSTLDLKTFYWNDLAASTTNASTTILQYGFLAQDVEKVFPELVHEEDTYKTLDYGTLGMYAIQGLKELNTKVDSLDLKLAGLTSSTPQESEQGFVQAFFDNLFAKIREWLADAANNIVAIIADTLKARDQLCIGSTCVTESQLQAMLANATEAANPGSGQHEHSPSVAPDTEPPAITINGNNPAYPQVGDTYSDLGAIVADNIDQNLGIKTYLNGVLVSDIMLDTSSPATYTIDYVATDNAGNTATSTRNVIVEAPSIAPSDAPVEEPEGEQENQDEPTTAPLPAEL